jgi:dUTP pyrophosphatase
MTSIHELKRRIQRLEHITRSTVIGIDFKRLNTNAQLPIKAGPEEACYDIHCIADESFSDQGTICLCPGDSHVFHTGLASYIPSGYGVFLWDRSGMGAKRNIHRLAGVIDSTYRGEWMVPLTNLGKKEQYIKAGDRIIQAYIAVILPSTVRWVDELPESYRGDSGLGSTGA